LPNRHNWISKTIRFYIFFERPPCASQIYFSSRKIRPQTQQHLATSKSYSLFSICAEHSDCHSNLNWVSTHNIRFFFFVAVFFFFSPCRTVTTFSIISYSKHFIICMFTLLTQSQMTSKTRSRSVTIKRYSIHIWHSQLTYQRSFSFQFNHTLSSDTAAVISLMNEFHLEPKWIQKHTYLVLKGAAPRFFDEC
jgi:hypothetical protein